MSKTYTLREAKLILRNRALKKTIATLRDQLSTMRSAFIDVQQMIRNNDKDAEIERLQAKQRWVTTSPKKMPKDKVWVLVLINEQIFRAQRYGGKWMLDTKKFVPIYPSKWMPLPEVS